MTDADCFKAVRKLARANAKLLRQQRVLEADLIDAQLTILKQQAQLEAAAIANAMFGHVHPRFTSEASANSAAWARALAVVVMVVGAGSSSAMFEVSNPRCWRRWPGRANRALSPQTGLGFTAFAGSWARRP